MPSVEPMLTPAEVADRCRVSETTVKRLCRSGALPASKVGKAWRIMPRDLDAYLEGGRR